MHLAIDGSLWGGEERGVAVSTRRLFMALARQRGKHAITALVPREAELPEDLLADDSPARLVRISHRQGARRAIWQQVRLPDLVRRSGADALYAPYYTAPLRLSVPYVLTVHDLIAWTHPHHCHWANRAHLRTLLGQSIRRAAQITVPTHTVKRDLLEILGVPEQKVHVVPWGVDLEIEPWPQDEAREMVARRFGLAAPFLFFAGCLEPKKNISQLLDAADHLGVDLVLAGPSGWGRSRLPRLLATCRPYRVRHLGYTTTGELSALYAAALAFVFPSHVEGFGLPVLEAMYCGAPVVASDASALCELTEGAALHFQCGDRKALAEALAQVIRDEPLRRSLVERGRDRAALFTWTRTAQLFSQALEQISA